MNKKDFFLEFGKKPVALAGHKGASGDFYVLFAYPNGSFRNLRICLDAEVGDGDDFVVADIYAKMLRHLTEQELRKLQSKSSEMQPISGFADNEIVRRHKSVRPSKNGKLSDTAGLVRARSLVGIER